MYRSVYASFFWNKIDWFVSNTVREIVFFMKMSNNLACKLKEIKNMLNYTNNSVFNNSLHKSGVISWFDEEMLDETNDIGFLLGDDKLDSDFDIEIEGRD